MDKKLKILKKFVEQELQFTTRIIEDYDIKKQRTKDYMKGWTVGHRDAMATVLNYLKED